MQILTSAAINTIPMVQIPIWAALMIVRQARAGTCPRYIQSAIRLAWSENIKRNRRFPSGTKSCTICEQNNCNPNRPIHKSVWTKMMSWKKGSEDTWVHQMGVYLRVIKPVRPYITPQEYLVLMFIFDRTCCFKKTREIIPLRHFLKGINSRDREVVATRVGLSKTNLVAALNHLQNKNIIFSDYVSRGGSCFYEITPLVEIDFEYIQSYVEEHQPKELARGLIINHPSNNPMTEPRPKNIGKKPSRKKSAPKPRTSS